MGLYRHFYFECRDADGWSVPPSYRCESESDEESKRGYFAWVRPNTGWWELFWGPKALFPIRSGLPDDRRGSPLFAYYEQFDEEPYEDLQLCWMPYEDLLIDCWDTDKLTAVASVPARLALLFGDGTQPVPQAELMASGLSEIEIDNLLSGRRRHWDPPIDNTIGQERYFVEKSSPSEPIRVTWRPTIAQFIGERMADAFKDLRRYGSPEDLRILSVRG